MVALLAEDDRVRASAAHAHARSVLKLWLRRFRRGRRALSAGHHEQRDDHAGRSGGNQSRRCDAAAQPPRRRNEYRSDPPSGHDP
jgi:hypothetical protein